jgi:hypothetical protein
VGLHSQFGAVQVVDVAGGELVLHHGAAGTAQVRHTDASIEMPHESNLIEHCWLPRLYCYP